MVSNISAKEQKGGMTQYFSSQQIRLNIKLKPICIADGFYIKSDTIGFNGVSAEGW